MTCLFLCVEAERLTLMSDGAAYEKESAHLTQVTSKQIIKAEIDMALAAMGDSAVLLALEVHLRVKSPRNFDEFTDMLPQLLEQSIISVRQSKGFCGSTMLLGGGFSSKYDRMRGFVVDSDPIEELGLEAFEMREAIVFARPDPSPENVARYIGTDITGALKEMGPGTFGFRYISAVRKSDLAEDEDDAVHCCVGGFIQQTTVGRGTGISTRIVHRWADEIGEPMNPANDPPDGIWDQACGVNSD